MPLSTLVEQVSAAPPPPSSEPVKGKPPPPPPKEEPPAPPLPPEEAKVIDFNKDVICSHLKLNFLAILGKKSVELLGMICLFIIKTITLGLKLVSDV